MIWQNGSAERDTNPLVASMATGVVATDGWRIVRRNANYFDPADVVDIDLALVCGGKGRWKRIARAHQDAGTPVLMLELGYLNRITNYRSEEHHYQCGIDRLCWLPPVECPSDRFEKLGLKLRKRRTRKGDHVLILGQVPGDGQHGFDADELTAWYADAVSRIKMNTEQPIVFRPHPRVAKLDLCPSADEQQDAVMPLAEAIKSASVCVTFNSTAGTEALLNAIPVICAEPAMYAPWAETDFSNVESPRMGDREDYFNRLAYAQWTHAELRSGEAFAFLRQFWRPANERRD